LKTFIAEDWDQRKNTDKYRKVMKGIQGKTEERVINIMIKFEKKLKRPRNKLQKVSLSYTRDPQRR
jgi:hypothetical protein